MTDETLEELREALVAIVSPPPGPRPDLTAALARIERIRERNAARLPPSLAHYLERRSYAKALDFLDGKAGDGT